MISFLKDWITNIVALVFFIVIIEMLVPSGRMKKYAALITGVILIIAIINPFLKLFGNKFNFEDILTEDSNYFSRAEMASSSKLYKDEQNKQILEVYRKKIIAQLEDSAKKVDGVSDAKGDVILNEDFTSDKLGEIKRAYLQLTMKDGIEEAKAVIKIDRIKVGQQNESIEPNNNKSIDPSIEKKLRDRIVSLFGLEENNIVISAK